MDGYAEILDVDHRYARLVEPLRGRSSTRVATAIWCVRLRGARAVVVEVGDASGGSLWGPMKIMRGSA